MKTKIKCGDNILFRELEGEVVQFISHYPKCNLRKCKTFRINFYIDDIDLEFKVTKNGYKIITSNSPKWLINSTYKPKEFHILFRPGNGMKDYLNYKEIKDYLSSIQDWKNPGLIRAKATILLRKYK